MEKTLIILKPDAVDRRLVGDIISRCEIKGLQILALKMTMISPALAEKHYEAHRAKPFYSGLVKFMTSGPVVLMVLGGTHAVEAARKLMGETAGYRSPPGTVRGDLALSSKFNLIHGSDSAEAAERELELFFRADELMDYELGDSEWFEES